MNRAESEANTLEGLWIGHVAVMIFRQTFRRGFHGQTPLTITVQDGTIQYRKHAIEQNHRRPEQQPRCQQSREHYGRIAMETIPTSVDDRHNALHSRLVICCNLVEHHSAKTSK